MKNSELISTEVTRRSFLRTAAVAGIAVSPAFVSSRAARQRADQSSFLDVVRVPDEVTAYSHFEKTMPQGRISLARQGEEWTGKNVVVETKVEHSSLVLTLRSPSTPIAAVHARWRIDVPERVIALSDAWERSYGELGWRNLIPERVMPWYFATYDLSACHAYGVRTDARALCFWQLDSQGVSLWLNVTNGGNGVEPGQRPIAMATLVSRRGATGEDAIDSIAELCRQMCARISRPSTPIYGANDWDYSYGQSTSESILRDTEFIVSVSPAGSIRPFSVIDGGWTNGTAAWPDMGKLAGHIRQRGARPGIWVRPLEASGSDDAELLLNSARFGDRKDRARELAYDPTAPAAREKIRAKLRQAADWGYEMVKHDFSTYDLLGQWGFEMGPQPTLPGWSLYDRTRTNAEVIADLYQLLREIVGERILLDGCNTIGHLGQGVFDLQRIGDDTSGHQWERTRRMGVNTLAFRLPQHGTFYALDADLVGITDAVPWEFNRQWLDLVAHSGTATIVSVAPSQRGPEQRAALRDAFQVAAAGGTGVKPLGWMETSAPTRWQGTGKAGAEREKRYNWNGADGAFAFLSP